MKSLTHVCIHVYVIRMYKYYTFTWLLNILAEYLAVQYLFPLRDDVECYTFARPWQCNSTEEEDDKKYVWKRCCKIHNLKRNKS